MTDQGGECMLLEGPAAISAQLLLAIAAIAPWSIRGTERGPRGAFKSGVSMSASRLSRQALRTCVAQAGKRWQRHVVRGAGIIIAILASESGKQTVSQCAWYFVAYTFDTTLGVGLAIGIHTGAVRLAIHQGEGHQANPKKYWKMIAESGNYGSPPHLQPFLLQLAEWTGAVVLSRIVCGSVVIACKSILVPVAHVLHVIFQGHPNLLLFFVMIMCPLTMNILQALVQDAVLRWRKGGGSHAPEANEESDGEMPLHPKQSEGLRLMMSHQHSTA